MELPNKLWTHSIRTTITTKNRNKKMITKNNKNNKIVLKSFNEKLDFNFKIKKKQQ